MPPENRLDLWDVNTRLKSIPWIPNETRVSFRNETPVSIGIVIFVNKNNLCFFLIFGVSSIYFGKTQRIILFLMFCIQYAEIRDIVSKAFFKITTIYHLFVCIKNIKTEIKSVF